MKEGWNEMDAYPCFAIIACRNRSSAVCGLRWPSCVVAMLKLLAGRPSQTREGGRDELRYAESVCKVNGPIAKVSVGAVGIVLEGIYEAHNSGKRCAFDPRASRHSLNASIQVSPLHVAPPPDLRHSRGDGGFHIPCRTQRRRRRTRSNDTQRRQRRHCGSRFRRQMARSTSGWRCWRSELCWRGFAVDATGLVLACG